MSNPEVSQQGVFTPILILFSAFLASFAYILANLVPMTLDIQPENNLYEVFVGITSILFAIGFTVYVQRKIHQELGFGRLFVVGWMTTLLMSIFISFFYVISFLKGWIPLHEGESAYNIIPVVILKYNALGMIFSSLLAIMFKRQITFKSL